MLNATRSHQVLLSDDDARLATRALSMIDHEGLCDWGRTCELCNLTEEIHRQLA